MVAGTTQQVWSLGLLRSSEEEDNKSFHKHNKAQQKSHGGAEGRPGNSKVGSVNPDTKHKVIKESLWIDGWYNPSLVDGKLRRRGLPLSTQVQDKELFQKKEMLTHNTVLFSEDDESTALVASLRACAKNKDLYRGTRIHDEISKRGSLEKCSDALITMYAKCGKLKKARELLDMYKSRDVISWTALIAGYARQGQSLEALNCFEQMQREGVSPTAVTFSCILKACGNMKAVDIGKQIHEKIARQGLLRNDVVLGTALVDMYAKCGDFVEAQRVFEELPSRDVFTWSALIAAYAQQGQGEQALNCFEQMRREGLSPDAVTFACILKACGTIGAADKGEQIHDEIAKKGLLRNNVVLGTALVDMYAKCGALAKAQEVLDELPSRNVISWNALITGYAQQGQDEQALDCFKRMQHDGCAPDAVTFSCVLNVCSHLGLVEDGHMYFVNMSSKYGIKPDLGHYTCMVDLFGRAGHLEKAASLIQEMPSSNYTVVWLALLSACRKWGDVNVGRWAFERVVEVDKSDGAAYVLMASIYIAAGMQEYAEEIEAMRMENRAWTPVEGGSREIKA